MTLIKTSTKITLIMGFRLGFVNVNGRFCIKCPTKISIYTQNDQNDQKLWVISYHFT